MDAKAVPKLGENCALESDVPLVTDIAAGSGWRVRDVVCRAKVGERVFEEQHERHVIAAVHSGMFSYHGKAGRALLHSGVLLVGNAGQCFCCGHDHSDGDRCMALQLDDDLYAEIASSSAGRMSFEFTSAHLPLARDVYAAQVKLVSALNQGDVILKDEAVLHYVEAVLLSAAQTPPSKNVVHRKPQKIAEVVALIERHSSEALTLQQLAEHAELSRYHFLRVFKQTMGMTPYQFILLTRLKRAVDLLTTTKLPIIEVSLSSGFGDLSTFNKMFKAQTGKTPRMLRH